MSTSFPMGYINVGRDYNYFRKAAVSSSLFGGSNAPFYTPDGYQNGFSPDFLIDFPTYTVQFVNLGSGSTNVVEYSFNGNTVHGELNPTNSTVSLTFQNRVISPIWFRVQAGSSGPITVSIQAWSVR